MLLHRISTFCRAGRSKPANGALGPRGDDSEHQLRGCTGGRRPRRRGGCPRGRRARLRAALPPARGPGPRPRPADDGPRGGRRGDPGRVRARLGEAGHLPGRGGFRDLALPAGHQPDAEPPGLAGRPAAPAGRPGGDPGGADRAAGDDGPGNGLRGRDRAPARGGAPGVRPPRRGRLQARGDRGYAQGDLRNHQGAAPPGADAAAAASRGVKEATMTHEWADRLSEYLDGELNARERAGVEAHVKGCPECARTLAGLEAVVARARRLPERAPEADLWPGIERRLAPRGRVIDLRALLSGGRRVSVPVPQLLAAALVLMLLSAGAVWLALERRTTLRAVPGLEPAANAALGTSDATVPEAAGVVAADFGFSRYDAAIADLERILAQHRGQLDPA